MTEACLAHRKYSLLNVNCRQGFCFSDMYIDRFSLQPIY